MNKALFIDETFLKTTTPILNNVDLSELRQHIISYQDIVVQNSIGYLLYKRLCDRIIASTLTSDDINLLNKLSYQISWGCYGYSIPFISLKYTNKGINQINSENTISSTLAEINFLKNQAISRSEFYGEQVLDFLRQNPTLYPEYSLSDGYNIQSSKYSYTSEIFFFNGSNDCKTNYDKPL